MSGYETLVRALGAEPAPGQLYLRCPAHDDRRESLSVAEGDDGRALLICYAGCPTREVVAALGLEMGDLFSSYDGAAVVQQYVYEDEEGRPLLRVLRQDPKGFTQQRWDETTGTWKPRLLHARRVPYRLPELLAAEDVWLVEGEKDAETLRSLDLAATTLLGGAGKWRDEYAEHFARKRVTIVADNDEAGIAGASRVKMALRSVAASARIVLPLAGKDVTDHLNAGYTLPQLTPYVLATDELFQPFDWRDYEARGTEWLFEPYIPRASRVLAYGAAGSLKSLWAMWVGVRLAREGHRVAYFSLEMRPSETAKRLRKMDPPADLFKWYSKFSFGSSTHLEAACELLQGYSLIVVDSWSAVQSEGQASNDTVAQLDREVFQPLIDSTGAALLVLDNVGHPAITDRGVIRPQHARGASAKGDKMDLTLMFERPLEGDNHRTTITVKKMRLDRRLPSPLTVKTDPDEIEFIVTDEKDAEYGSMWAYFGSHDWQAPPSVTEPETVAQKLAAARARARLGEMTSGSEDEGA